MLYNKATGDNFDFTGIFMKKLYDLIEKCFDISGWKNLALRIYNIESNFCYSDFEKSAKLCRDELEKSGAKDVEMRKLKADGKKIYGDFIMPSAWDWESAKLEIFEPEQLKGKILADTKLHPFHIANRCGEIQETIFDVIDIKHMSKYKTCTNFLVFCGNIHPRECREQIEKTGATGIISCFSKAPEVKDGIFWVNGWVKNSGWYHTAEDRKMVCFSITPEQGQFLQKLLDSGPVKVKTFVKSRTYNGDIYSITGIIPGKSKKEICLLAHMYEPMITDNATGVSGLIEICRIINQLINEKKFYPDTGIRFLFSMERYGMMEFFERKHNVVYAFNVDGIADDIVKTGQMFVKFYGSPFTIPFFGDWLFEELLSECFPYPWKKQRPVYEDDTFVSDSSINIPSGYFISHPGKLHHNSYLEKTVNWELGKKILVSIATYFCILSSKSLREKYLQVFESSLKEEFYSYLSKLPGIAEQIQDSGIKKRIFYVAEYLQRKYLSIAVFGNKPDTNVIAEIDEIAKKYSEKIPNTSTEENLSREDKKARNIVITWRKPCFIFSLSGIEHKERIHPPEQFHSLVNRVDGKKDLYEIYNEIDFEKEYFGESRLKEFEKKQLTEYVLYLAGHNYLKIKYRTILTKQQIKSELEKLGIRRTDKIIVHSSLSSMGYVKGGAKAVCEALMELVGKDGIVMMPSFNHGTIFENNPEAYFSPLETPTINGAIPDTFWRMKNVYRSLHPTHSFAVWGKNAKDFVRNHHRVLTMGKGSPLHLLEQYGGKIVLIDAFHSNTFHHVVEMTNNVPCLGKRTEQYPVKLPSGKIVYCRTWGWRDGICEITDKAAYLDYMIKHNLLKKGKIGNASVFVIDMKTCRTVIEKFLSGSIKGYPGCKKCNIKPRKVLQTVESDWDDVNESVKPDSTAFTGEYEPL